MKDQFEEFIFQTAKAARDNEVQEILSIFSEKRFDKGALFKKQDTIIQELGFLVDGSARSYFINENREEITDEVLQKKHFLTDIISIRSFKKSQIIIELLEESNVLAAPMDQVRDLLNNNITFNILVREYMGHRAMGLLKRHLMFLTGTAKERYQYLITTNPSLLEKFPLKYIASMIGVTPTQLSRIRSKKS
jgi:CRP-like cAMP-binding protein